MTERDLQNNLSVRIEMPFFVARNEASMPGETYVCLLCYLTSTLVQNKVMAS